MDKTKAGFVAIVGAPNAGKSTFLNTALGQKVAIVTPKAQTTRTNMRGIYSDEENGLQIVFVDTPGIHKPKRLLEKGMMNEAHKAWTEADAILLMVDSVKGFDEQVEHILDNLKDAGKKPVILVLNKVDAVKKEKLLPLMQRATEFNRFAAVYAISADKNKGVDDVLKGLSRYLPESPFLYSPDEVTDTPAREIAAEITRERAFMLLQQEIPYSLAVETITFEERDDGSFKIHQTILLERDGQKKIVVGRGGEVLKKIGEQARKQMEHVFDCQVHLFLHVKVKKDWSEDPRVMKSFGLDPQ